MRDALPTVGLGLLLIGLLIAAWRMTVALIGRQPSDYLDDALIQRDGSLRKVESMTPVAYPVVLMDDEESGV